MIQFTLGQDRLSDRRIGILGQINELGKVCGIEVGAAAAAVIDP